MKESLTRQKKKWKEQGQERAWGALLGVLEFVPEVWRVPGASALGIQEAALRIKGGGSEERKGRPSWSHPHWPQKGNSCRADGEEAKDLSRVPACHAAVFLHTGVLEGGCEMLPVSLVLSQDKSAHLGGISNGKHKLDQYFLKGGEACICSRD